MRSPALRIVKTLCRYERKGDYVSIQKHTYNIIDQACVGAIIFAPGNLCKVTTTTVAVVEVTLEVGDGLTHISSDYVSGDIWAHSVGS